VTKLNLVGTTSRITVSRAFATGIFEVIPALYLQTALFSFTFDETSQHAKIKQLVSLGLSGLGTLKLAFSILSVVLNGLIKGAKDQMGCFVKFGIYGFIFGSFGLVAICAARIYFSYSCPDHIWNVTTGWWTVLG